MSVVCLAAALALTSYPPVYFEQTTVTFRDGRAVGEGVFSKVWSAGQSMRLEAGGAAGGSALILRLDRGRAYRIDPEGRRAVEIPLERLRARSQMDLAMAGDLMGIAEGRARTVALKRVKTIAGYRCRGFRVSAGSTVMELFVAPGLPLGTSAFTDFLEWSGASDSLGGLMDELRALPGFPLETRTRVTVLGEVHETLATITAVKVGPQPASLFEPPPGYRLEREEEP